VKKPFEGGAGMVPKMLLGGAKPETEQLRLAGGKVACFGTH
jgi:hypothetical protein